MKLIGVPMMLEFPFPMLEFPFPMVKFPLVEFLEFKLASCLRSFLEWEEA
jgi:hypothetical protein